MKYYIIVLHTDYDGDYNSYLFDDEDKAYEKCDELNDKNIEPDWCYEIEEIELEK